MIKVVNKHRNANNIIIGLGCVFFYIQCIGNQHALLLDSISQINIVSSPRQRCSVPKFY